MKAFYGLVLVASLLMLSTPSGMDSCAIGPPEPVFTAKQRPADLAAFAKGKVGVVQVRMGRLYLVGAFRMLSGIPLTNRETAAWYPGKKQAVQVTPGQPVETASPTQRWLNWRNRISGVAAIQYIQTDRVRRGADEFVMYGNCLDDGFVSAQRTLEARATKWGESDPKVKQWIEAQDQVFANCAGEKPAIPAPLPAGADALAAADRKYQIAAAWFYAGDWEKARKELDEIAADTASPWSGIAPYLVGRAFLREATLEKKPEAFGEAERRFQAVLRDAGRQQWHEASRSMLSLIQARRDPAAELRRLGEQLTKAGAAADPGTAAADFVYLYGTNAQKPLSGAGELAEWIDAIENRPPADPKPIARWRESKNPAWLIAALQSQDEKDDSDLLQAARSVRPDSPAYESAAYFGLEREIAAGHKEEARAWADEVLGHDLLLSTRNLIRGQRMRLARDWSEFLRFAPRGPEPKLEMFDYTEVDTDKAPEGTAPLFDTDSLGLWNGRIPLGSWLDAAGNPLLPAHLQLQLAEAGWVRAVLLERDREAGEFGRRMTQLKPAYRPVMQTFLAAANPEDARFAAVMLLLRSPAVLPDVQGGAEAPDPRQVSSLGSGRWCFGEAPRLNEDGKPVPDAGFLSAEQRATAAEEWRRLFEVAPSGANYLAKQALARAESNPDDPRVPEALHFAVQATRRGCTNEETGKVSKQAFDLLHQRYPKSAWTAQTRYWYK